MAGLIAYWHKYQYAIKARARAQSRRVISSPGDIGAITGMIGKRGLAGKCKLLLPGVVCRFLPGGRACPGGWVSVSWVVVLSVQYGLIVLICRIQYYLPVGLRVALYPASVCTR